MKRSEIRGRRYSRRSPARISQALHPGYWLRPAGELEAFVESRVAARRRRHQEAVAFADDAFHVVAVHVGVAHHDVVLLAGRDHARHPFEHHRMLVLPRITELLVEIALS